MAQTFILPRALPRDRVIAAVYGFLSGLAPDKAWKLEISQHKAKRSDQQNRALWGVAYKTLRDLTGNDPDDLHVFFLGEHFGWTTVEVMGAKRRVPLRTSKNLSKTEFAEFYAFIQQRSAENGYYVPDPNEVDA